MGGRSGAGGGRRGDPRPKLPTARGLPLRGASLLSLLLLPGKKGTVSSELVNAFTG